MQRGIGLIVGGAVLTVLGVLFVALESSNHGVCGSALGAFAPRACVSANLFYFGGWVALVTGLAVGVIGIASYARQRSVNDARLSAQGWPRPGWYEVEPGWPLRWWDGGRWGEWLVPPPPPRRPRGSAP